MFIICDKKMYYVSRPAVQPNWMPTKLILLNLVRSFFISLNEINCNFYKLISWVIQDMSGIMLYKLRII